MIWKTLKIEIRSRQELFREARETLERVSQGAIPEMPSEGLFFEDLKTLLDNLTPGLINLLKELHGAGRISAADLARRLRRQARTVEKDIRGLADLGLVEIGDDGLVSAPYDKIQVVISLGA